MPETLDDISIHHSKEYIDLVGSDKKVITNFIVKGRIRQIDLYCLLKGKFGPPNGIQTMLRGDHSNNLIQWDYSLKICSTFVDILGSARFLEVRIVDDNKRETKLTEEILVEFFQKVIKQNKSTIQKEWKKLEHWSLFINTHKRLDKLINETYDVYRSVILNDPIKLDSPVVTKKKMKIYMNQIKKLQEKVDKKKQHGLIIRMLTPVAAESLLNLVLFVSMNEEVRNDKRLFDSILRNQIDIRIKTMHLYCKAVEKQYSQDDERFKKFMKMMDSRNDFLHGNVTPAVNCFDDVLFDGTIPIFSEERDIGLELVKQNLFQVNNDDIEEVKEAYTNFKEFLLDNIKDEYRNQVEYIINLSQLGYNKDTRKIGALFDDEMFQSFLIKD